MTTATPTFSPLAEPLLDDHDRRVCEMKVNVGGPTLATCRYVPCGRSADWIMHASFPCGHQPPITALVCGECRQDAGTGCDAVCGDGYRCVVPVVIRWSEPLR